MFLWKFLEEFKFYLMSESCRLKQIMKFDSLIRSIFTFRTRGDSAAKGNILIGSFQPNSNRGVHPMSWILFLLSILVDIIETKKFCEFEISTLFRFCVAAIRNIGGGGRCKK